MGKRPKPVIVAGLDVGTTKICAIVAELMPYGGLNIIGVGQSPSRGLRKGVVVNIDSTVEAIRSAVAEAEQLAGLEIESVVAGVAGGHIRGINSRGVVAVSGKGREVSATDVERALEAARAINLPPDREVIHVLPQTFVVDDQDGIKEPLGMSGVRLEVEVHIVTGAVTGIQNVIRSVNRAGLAVQDIVLEPLASSQAVLSADENELGVLLIDIGGGTTDVALFHDGAVWHTSVLALGGDHITNDIAVGLRTPVAEAEELKRRDGCALTALVSDEETVEVASVGGRKARVLSRQVLSEIIQPRVEEIFTLVARELARTGLQDAATAGVVVTGGTSLMEGVLELAEQVFDLPVRRGVPDGVGGLGDVVRSPIFATGVGLALHGAEVRGRAASPNGSDGRLLQWIRRRMRDWFSEIF
ncbi:MAG: cell division protein FtsA [Candidatus Methylomirabilia bacterium]